MSSHTLLTGVITINSFDSLLSRNDLADFLEIPRRYLTYILYVKGVENLYKVFDIPKKNGDSREIHAPVDELKSIQRKLGDALWKYQESYQDAFASPRKLSHAFEKHKSIFTNAHIHRNKRFVLNVDIKDFFKSIHFGRVKGYFEKHKEFTLTSEVATIIAQLACYKGYLPQGAPCSPIIANMISQTLDIRLLKLTKRYKLDYTRYADDLTFSTNKNDFNSSLTAFMHELKTEIDNFGFKINDNKTRIQFKNTKQVVTGLIVNKKINIDRNYQKVTRAMAYTLYKKGSYTIDGHPGTINKLEGRFSFIDQIDHYNNKLDKIKHNFRQLNGREKQYQAFLFYKYFYANRKLLIITEGKTDIAYIKAALKNLHTNYPRLVNKHNDKFDFNITFLRRTKRLSYFFGFSPDGATTMMNIYNFYSGKNENGFRNYPDYFHSLGMADPLNKVVLLYDNELITAHKPLKTFVSKLHFNDNRIQNLQHDLNVHLKDNLYLVTIPLVGTKNECEIEDLFDAQTLSHTIGGKHFSRNSEFDNTLYYGKEIFSKYISKDYENINFANFTLLLDKISELVN